MEKENPPRLLRAHQKHAALIASRGWKSTNSSPLSVEGEVFSLTFPFIELGEGKCPDFHFARPGRVASVSRFESKRKDSFRQSLALASPELYPWVNSPSAIWLAIRVSSR